MKKLVLDQVVYAPFMLVTVLAYTSVMKDLNENTTISRDRVLEDYKLNLREKGGRSSWRIARSGHRPLY